MDSSVFLTTSQRREKNLYRESDNKFRCQYCEVWFSRNSDCIKHEQRFHQIKRVYSCTHCEQFYHSVDELNEHTREHIVTESSFKLYKSAFDGASEIYRKTIVNDPKYPDPSTIFARKDLLKEIVNLMVFHAIKRRTCFFTITVHSVFVKYDLQGDVNQSFPYITNTPSQKINFTFNRSSLLQILVSNIKDVNKRLEDFAENGSGWALVDIPFIDLSFTTTKALKGGCSVRFPSRQGLLIIRNSDQYCLLYCILAFFYKGMLPAHQRISHIHYQTLFDKFDLNGFSFPMSPDEISNFESHDGHNLPSFRVNVYTEVDNEIFPIKISPKDQEDRNTSIINVLLVEGFDENTNTRLYHYILISNPSIFISKRYTKHSRQKFYACEKCFSHFYSIVKFQDHQKVCGKDNKSQLMFYPKTHKKIQYDKPWAKAAQLLVGYLDFESLVVKNKDSLIDKCITCSSDPEIKSCTHSFSNQIQTHIPINYSFLVVDRFDKVLFERKYTGMDAIEDLLMCLYELKPKIKKILESYQEMVLSSDDKKHFEQQTFCYMCNKRFNPFTKSLIKVRDHCHATARYLGAACNSCNMNRRERSLMKIFTHNFSGYDSHLLISKLDKSSFEDITAVPKTGEKFLSLSLDNFYTFVDSMSFLPGSLDALVKTLPSDHPFNLLKQSKEIRFFCKSDEDFNLLFGKWKFRKFKILIIYFGLF